jgi:hypothetical protein
MEEAGSPPPSLADQINAFFGLSRVPKDGADLTKVEKLAAAIDSANYLNSRMAGCPRFGGARQLLTAGMNARSVPNGLVMEFGVYSGKTINHIASLEAGTIWGFDSFEGLPEDWRPDIRKGNFKRTDLPEVLPNVELVVGWFENTLPGFLAAHPEPVSFMHVDCDLYSSTRTVLHFLRDRIVPGTIIVFDEYFNYVGWRAHEFKAFAEFIAASGLNYRYIGAVPSHQQVAVAIV